MTSRLFQRALTTLKSPPPAARYGGRQTVTMIPGDGIGPELMAQVKQLYRFAGLPVDFETVNLTHESTEEDVADAIISIKRNGVALKGNIETNFRGPTATLSKNARIRTELDLFANVLSCKSMAGIETRHKDIDLVIIRENTEGEYSSLEHESVDGVVESLKIITAEKSLRIAKYAFDYAKQHGRKRVTAIHKANIMKLADGLFFECCRETSKHYPDIEFNDLIIDNCCMQMVSRPQQFDVMVMPNLYGNIVSNIGAGLVGGPGVVPGENIGADFAVFESATRNTGKSIAGKNIANPIALLRAGNLMLDHLNLGAHSNLIDRAITRTITEDQMDGSVWLGPNAVMAFHREGYSLSHFSLDDFTEVVTYRGFRKLVARHLQHGAKEIIRSLSIPSQVEQLRKFVPKLTSEDVLKGPSGVRAQALDRDRNLVDDFVFDTGTGQIGTRVLHVKNAPSPAATSSLAIAKVVADTVEEKFEL